MKPQTLTHKLIAKHLVAGEMIAGQKICLKIDQTLTQDATGTMAYLQFEKLNLERVKTELSLSYVDHNTLQMGFKNPDDHKYLRSIAKKYGIIFSPAGSGICHQLHLENFAKPGKTLIGSDSHTPTAGGIGSFALGAGGLSVALAMAGQAYEIPMPKVFRINLINKLTGFASAKDIILKILQMLGVKGGLGAVFEYTGTGISDLSVPDRATITNMGAELGATTSIFPSDEKTRLFLKSMHREDDFIPLTADENAIYDKTIELDLQTIVPMAACPHSPDNVRTIAELAGLKIDQVCIGSCTNSSFSDLALVSKIIENKTIDKNLDLFIAPGSKQVIQLLIDNNLYSSFLHAGARILESSCGPCIGMGSSPSAKGVSVRTFNRNFEGRSGTQDSDVYLTSPITAAFCALYGKFTDPSTWEKLPKKFELPEKTPNLRHLFQSPPLDGTEIIIERGINIAPLPDFEKLPNTIEAKIVLKLGNNITTDHIMPAGAQITALRSNIPAISEFVFSNVDKDFVERAKKAKHGIIIAADNYGQGSSREHAALAPRYLGIQAIIAKSIARIHRANLVNFGILPLLFDNFEDYDLLKKDELIKIDCSTIKPNENIILLSLSSGQKFSLTHDLTQKEIDIIQTGGLLQYIKNTI